MSTFLQEEIVPHFNYWVYVVIMMLGLYAMIAKRNLVKKLMGMAIFQTAIILFYVSIAVKSDATIPIYYPEDTPGHGAHGSGPSGHGAPEHGANGDGTPDNVADENGADENGAGENGADENGADENGADENGADENGADGHNPLAQTPAEQEDGQSQVQDHIVDATRYANPLPHVLMLTAIVVGVATLGVGLAIVQKLYKQYGTVEEDEILAIIQQDPHQYDAVRPEGYRSQDI